MPDFSRRGAAAHADPARLAQPSFLHLPGYKSTVKRGPTQPLVPLKASLGELQPAGVRPFAASANSTTTSPATRAAMASRWANA